MILYIVAIILIGLIIWFYKNKKENLSGYTYERGKTYAGDIISTTPNRRISDCLTDCSNNPLCKRVTASNYKDGDYAVLKYVTP